MKRIKKSIQIIMALAMLLPMSCQDKEVIESNESGTDKLQFSPTLGEAHTATRAGESDNSVLKAASPAGNTSPHIVIKTYTGTPGSSLKPFFSDELGYFTSGNWDLNSGDKRFLPSGGMNLYAYFATNAADNAADRGDLTNIKYIPPTEATYPTLTFTIAKDDADQVDLIAAKAEGITSPNVLIAFRHILSQINFGVKGMNDHQITVKNIRINEVRGNGTFDYGTWLWTPDTNTAAHNYPYYFPNRSKEVQDSGTGAEYQTQGTPDDSQNSYFFGDGGKFGPGEDATFLYAQTDYAQTDPTKSPAYATKENTPAPLHNSLMLLPQKTTKNTKATVTFDYEIKKGDQLVRSGEKSVVSLNAYYDWEPNFRYVYLFKFDDPQKVTFDVIVEPWQNYNGGDGIVGTDELTPKNLFEKYVRPLEPGEAYSVPIGRLSSDFLCDWSLYTLDNSFIEDQTFTLSFDDVPFKNGKSVIIKPPFGFTATPSTLTAKGDVTFTAIHTYFTTVDQVNEAITSSGDYEFSVKDEVKLEDIRFTGSTDAKSSLTLHYLTSYGGAPPNDRWQMYDDKTAVYFPKDYALVDNTYTLYTIKGLKDVFDWMNEGGANSVGGDTTFDYARRMKTNINLSKVGSYDLAKVYKSSVTDNTKSAYVPIGNEANPYIGIFDGKGATISNLYINNPTQNSQGFFGRIGEYAGIGKVQNTRFDKVFVVGHDWVGGITGVQIGNSIIGCSVSGSVSGNTFIGGIAGSTWNALIYSCYSTATVSGGGDCYGITNSPNTLDCYYVAPSAIDNNNNHVPSIAALNGKTPTMNARLSNFPHTHHYVSGNLNSTTPIIAEGKPSLQEGGVLKGTFIQNWFALNWVESRWNEEMALLATLGMEYLVIDQVVEYNASGQYMSWYPVSEGVLPKDVPINPNADALELCMKACRAHGIKLFIGTFFDKRSWDEGAAVTNPQEWYNCIKTSNKIMRELTGFYFAGDASTEGNYTEVLAGWYFPYEVDDLNFKTDDAKTLLEDGIKAAITCRDELAATAKKPYLFSPFMNGNGKNTIGGTMSAKDYADLWEYIIINAGFKTGDILSPQDCIGVGKLIISDLDIWMPELKRATTTTNKGVEFWINVETFGPGGNATFLTKTQIPASMPYATKLISFSYPIYYSPNAGAYRQGDHNAYKAYYDTRKQP